MPTPPPPRRMFHSFLLFEYCDSRFYFFFVRTTNEFGKWFGQWIETLWGDRWLYVCAIDSLDGVRTFNRLSDGCKYETWATVFFRAHQQMGRVVYVWHLYTPPFRSNEQENEENRSSVDRANRISIHCICWHMHVKETDTMMTQTHKTRHFVFFSVKFSFVLVFIEIKYQIQKSFVLWNDKIKLIYNSFGCYFLSSVYFHIWAVKQQVVHLFTYLQTFFYLSILKRSKTRNKNNLKTISFALRHTRERKCNRCWAMLFCRSFAIVFGTFSAFIVAGTKVRLDFITVN